MKKVMGWREMIVFPELTNIPIKAKIDTGARTTALHAYDIEVVKERRKMWVYFDIHPLQKSQKKSVRVKAPFLEYRKIKSSVGHETLRPVIETYIDIGGDSFLTEVTLVNRDLMGFRLLVGRQTIKNKFLVDVGHSFLTRPKMAKVKKA
ncbi:MAG: RimK/LysX family protein [Bacteriovoracaceae bacterium]|nr:RimK/LysX family protein [Bacteriovoracaceae bacterium]